MENKHTNKQQLLLYHKNQLPAEDTLNLLEHVSKCTYCAGLFANAFEENNILPAPRNLKERVLMEVDTRRPRSSRKQLIFYNLRVCFAMCFALFLLIGTMFTTPSSLPPKRKAPPINSSILEEINASMNEFTYHLNKRLNTLVEEQQITYNK